MKILRHMLPLAALAMALALAPAAAGQEGEVVPPENSAAAQYTEAFPTAGGDKDAHAQRGRDLSPAEVIGPRNARRLERRGESGRAVAELTTETAPVVQGAPREDSEIAGGGGNDRTGRSGDGVGAARNGATGATVDVPEAGGSSGLGTVLSQAVGSSPSEGAGLLLPLLIVATIAWAVVYLSRHRQTAN
jgi:hypothetical protein